MATPTADKLKRSTEPTTVDFVPSLDVLSSLRAAAAPAVEGGPWFVGFAAETGAPAEIEARALDKLKRKRLDAIFVNAVARAGEKIATGFGGEGNAGTWLTREGNRAAIAHASKREVADRIWDLVAGELAR